MQNFLSGFIYLILSWRVGFEPIRKLVIADEWALLFCYVIYVKRNISYDKKTSEALKQRHLVVSRGENANMFRKSISSRIAIFGFPVRYE